MREDPKEAASNKKYSAKQTVKSSWKTDSEYKVADEDEESKKTETKSTIKT